MNKWNQACILGLSCILALGACSNVQTKAIETNVTQSDLNAYERWLLKTGTWVTRSLTNMDGRMYSGKEETVSRLAGVTRFYNNGTFRMVTMDTSLTYEGNWSISDDGKVFTLVGLGADGRPGFRIEAEVLTLNDVEFSYRTYPDANKPRQYVDVKMGPASIAESRILTRQSSVNPNSFSSSAN